MCVCVRAQRSQAVKDLADVAAKLFYISFSYYITGVIRNPNEHFTIELQVKENKKRMTWKKKKKKRIVGFKPTWEKVAEKKKKKQQQQQR